MVQETNKVFYLFFGSAVKMLFSRRLITTFWLKCFYDILITSPYYDLSGDLYQGQISTGPEYKVLTLIIEKF